MGDSQNLILSSEQVRQKIKRMAFQIFENNHEEKELIIAGIWLQGYKLAELLMNELQKIAKFKIELMKLELDKELPTQSEISLDKDVEMVRDKVVILVDDVLNTGRTLAYSLKPFLKLRVKKIETASLVNRSHTNFPISCTYTGYELSTTINDHVAVEIEGERMQVYLR